MFWGLFVAESRATEVASQLMTKKVRATPAKYRKSVLGSPFAFSERLAESDHCHQPAHRPLGA